MEKDKKPSIIAIIFKQKFLFLFNFFIVFILTFSLLYLFGLVPEAFKTTTGRYPDKEVAEKSGELPMRIAIPEISVDTQIYNPATTSTAVLNDFLSKGAVRFPGSGLLGGNGNVFLFGHSTGYKIVQNQAYKTFNSIQTLKKGDAISVFSEKSEYVYKVLSIEHVDATKALIEFDTNNKILTLSTCDNFGALTDRYVVKSEFVLKKDL